MGSWSVLTVVVLGIWPAGCAIFHLNESEYRRMPPLFGLDDYEACLSEPPGLYCLVKMDLYAEPGNKLMHMIREYSEVVSKHYNYSYIERGVCVRQSCSEYIGDGSLNSTAELQRALSECVDAEVQKYGVRARLGLLYYCDTPNTNNIRSADWLDWAVAAVCAAFIAANVLSTLYDYLINFYNEPEKEKGNKYLLSFSMIRNWQWLVTSDYDDPRLRRLKGFYGARTITNILMILGHTISIIGTGFIDYPHKFENTYESVWYRICYNGLMIVQVFFFMSGFLLVYNYLIRVEKIKSSWKAIPVVMFLRWWRLTPSYAVMIAFTATWFRFVNSGPLWNLYVTTTVVADCRKYWWYHLLYINNYVPEDKFCGVQTWHIAVDTQLFLVGLVVYVFSKGIARKIILGFLLVLAVCLPAFHVWYHDLDGMMLLTPEFLRTMVNDTFRYMHVFGHNNLASYVVGMICGDLIYKWQTNGVKITNTMYSRALWLVFPAIVALLYSGQGFYSDGERASVLVRMLYASSNRLVLALIAAFGFVGMVMKNKIILRNILEWRGWMVPSRLSYTVYLLHFNFIYILHGIKTQMSPVSFYYLMLSHIGITTLSYIIALPFFLLVEAPLNRLMKNIMNQVSHLAPPPDHKQRETQFSRC